MGGRECEPQDHMVTEVLIDSASRRQVNEISGRTSGNTVVNLPAPADTTLHTAQGGWIGRTVPVRITRAGPHSLWGEAVSGLTSDAAVENESC